GSGALGAGGPARDVVVVLDGSASMDRHLGNGDDGTNSPRVLALRAARSLIAGLKPGDSVALLIAGDRVRPVIDPPSFDLARVDAQLAALSKAPSHPGSSDLPAAL